MADSVGIPREDIRAGLRFEFERDITEQDVSLFANLSGDRNALHIDAEYASGTNYGGRIVHGTLQTGIASAMLGMYLPGGPVLLGGIQARFPAPLFYPARILISGRIT